MNFGFLIDNRSCIGCHACSTACKSENEVPLGVYRTWVKYTETGSYPDTTRHFQVTRCNHCANPPCARICPTGAMYQRADGIVEFNKDACIGCKACMQACPYDAIHIDPETNTASKCHFCSHRVEVGLEPSCVVVCPTHSILAGDLDDPESEISKTVARNKVTVRKPEQGTAPKLFYIEGHEVNLTPTATERTPESFMWADVMPLHAGDHHGHEAHAHERATTTSRDGVQLRKGQAQGDPSAGPIHVGERVASHMVQVGYNAQHKIPWHWPVPAYLVTKSIAAGVFLFLAIAFLLRLIPYNSELALVGGVISTVFMAATTALLVYDLDKPMRFLYILMRPQWRSWLTRGAVFLIGFSTIAGLLIAVEAAELMSLVDADILAKTRPYLYGVGIFFAVGAAIYTAFLFGQAEGRDLWQSTLLPFHLIVQAAMVGSAVVLAIPTFMDVPTAVETLAQPVFGISIVLDLFLLLFGELGMTHASEVAARAAHMITKGRYRHWFWMGAIALGHVMPLALLWLGGSALNALAALTTIIGLYCYEHAFVMAPQEIPNS